MSGDLSAKIIHLRLPSNEYLVILIRVYKVCKGWLVSMEYAAPLASLRWLRYEIEDRANTGRVVNLVASDAGLIT